MIDGRPTIADAAAQLGVSAKTIREWIRKEIVDTPPTFVHGLRTVQMFPPEYVEQIERQVAAYREAKTKEKGRNSAA